MQMGENLVHEVAADWSKLPASQREQMKNALTAMMSQMPTERRFELAQELYKAHVFDGREFEDTLIHASVKSELNHKHDKPTDRIATVRYLAEQRKLDEALSEISQKRRQAVKEAIKKGSD